MAGSGEFDPGVASIVDAFVRARREGRALPDYPGDVPQDLATAYRCQELAIGRWPDQVGGWKVARIAPHARDQYPEERLIGPAFKRNIHFAVSNTPVECPVFQGGFAAVEAELVVRIGKTSPQETRKWTLEAAAEYVGSLHIGVEVASSPLATLNQLGPGAVISDFGNNWGVIVGPEVKEWRSISQIAAQTFIDDESVGQGVASIRDGALGAVAFVLTKCAERGRRLYEGDVISTGMITGVHDVRVGQVSRLIFERYGEVQCRITSQAANP